jgi:predicted peptidase
MAAKTWILGGMISAGALFAQTQSQLQKAYGVTGSTKLSDGATMVFRLMVPADYNPAKKYPIVLHMHGIGERGNNNTSQLSYEIAKPWVSDSVQKKWSTFALAPQCPANGQWAGTAGDGAVKILDSLKKVYSLDTTRFYVGGLSWGGMGTLYIMQKYPDKFAAAVPHAGTVNPNGPALAKTPFWAFHGDADATVNVSGSRNAVAAVEKAGFPVVKFYAGKGGITCITRSRMATIAPAATRAGRRP